MEFASDYHTIEYSTLYAHFIINKITPLRSDKKM